MHRHPPEREPLCQGREDISVWYMLVCAWLMSSIAQALQVRKETRQSRAREQGEHTERMRGGLILGAIVLLCEAKGVSYVWLAPTV